MVDIENKILEVINLETSFDELFSDYNFENLNNEAFKDGHFTFINEASETITKYLDGQVKSDKFMGFLLLISKIFEQITKNEYNLANNYNYCVDVYSLSTELYEKSKDKGLPNKNYLVKLKRFIQDLDEPIYKLNISKDRKLDYLETCFKKEIVLMNAKNEIDKTKLKDFIHLLNIYIKENDPLALYIYGVCVSELNNCFQINYQTALRCFLLSSKSGNYRSFIKAGDIYYGGNLDKEKTFYRKAYECYIDSLLIEENEQARFRLSDMYLNGHCVSLDKNVAFKLISTSMKNVSNFYTDLNFMSCYPEVAYRYAKLLYEIKNYEDHNAILSLLRAIYALDQRRNFARYVQDDTLIDDIKKELAHFSKDKILDTITIFEDNNFPKKVKLVKDNLYLIKHSKNLHFIAKYIGKTVLDFDDIGSFDDHQFEVTEVTTNLGIEFEPKVGEIYNLNFLNCPEEVTKYKPHILTKDEKGYKSIESEKDIEEYITNPDLITNTTETKLIGNYDLDKDKNEIIIQFKNDGKPYEIKFVKVFTVSFPFKPTDNAKIISIETTVLKELGNTFDTKIEYIDDDENNDTIEISSACILVKE